MPTTLHEPPTLIAPRETVVTTPIKERSDESEVLTQEQPPQALTFGRTFAVATLAGTLAIFLATAVSWWATQGDFAGSVALGAYVAFWFGPAVGVIGGLNYWASKTHPSSADA